MLLLQKLPSVAVLISVHCAMAGLINSLPVGILHHGPLCRSCEGFRFTRNVLKKPYIDQSHYLFHRPLILVACVVVCCTRIYILQCTGEGRTNQVTCFRVARQPRMRDSTVLVVLLLVTVGTATGG